MDEDEQLFDYFSFLHRHCPSILLNKCYSGDRVKENRVVAHVAGMGEKKHLYCLQMPKPEVKRPFGIPRCKWQDNIKTDHKEVGCENMDWTNLDQNGGKWWTVVSTTMKIRAP